jgi:hypothetical protein
MGKREIRGMTLRILGERTGKDGYCRRRECDAKTMLVATTGHWEVDEETFESGEDTPEGTPDEVYVGEVSGHWCPECECLVSLSYDFS